MMMETLNISFKGNHAFYLYQFKKSKSVCKAQRVDFNVEIREVSTSIILCNEGDCLFTIDLDLTTTKAAEKADEKAVTEVVAAVVEMVGKNTDFRV